MNKKKTEPTRAERRKLGRSFSHGKIICISRVDGIEVVDVVETLEQPREKTFEEIKQEFDERTIRDILARA